ncbi:hypothetical protein OH687_38910 (plasmid) [Burkholderia anthina]|nr:hypothetical protein OH687_38910 [Burkholderia anthina]
MPVADIPRNPVQKVAHLIIVLIRWAIFARLLFLGDTFV